MAQTVKHPVLCVGVNPSFDTTLVLSELLPDCANRVISESVCAAGKAANVAAQLLRLDEDCALLGLAGADNAEKYAAMLSEQLGGSHSDITVCDNILCCSAADGRCSLAFAETAGSVRENLTILHGGETLKINRAGAACDYAAAQRLCALVSEKCTDGTIAVFSGSMPPGMTSEDYAHLMRCASLSGAKIAIDTEALDMRQLLELRPWLYKPNSHELAKLCGISSPDSAQLIECAQQLARSGVEIVLLTMGENGLAAVTANSVAIIPAEPVEVVCTVGAGDCSLAGFIAGQLRGCTIEESAKLASHCGALAVSSRKV